MAPEARAIRSYMNPFLEGDRKSTGLVHILKGTGLKTVRRDTNARKYLKEINPLEVAFVTLRTVFNMIHSQRITLTTISKAIGTALNDHAGYVNFKEKNPKYFKNVTNFVRMKNDSQKRVIIKNRANTSPATAFERWPELDRIKLGGVMLSTLCNNAKVGYTEGSYDPNKSNKKHKPTNIWVPYPELVEKLEEAHAYHEIRQPMHMPMIIPPLDWTNEQNGGHLAQHVGIQYDLVGPNKDSHKRDPKLSDLQPIMDAVNKLQAVPWRINKRVLEVIKEIRDRDGGIAGVVPLDKDKLFEDAPVRPWANDEEMEALRESNFDAYKKAQRPYMLRHEAWARNVSKRSGFLKQIDIAERFADEDAIYFCYTAEWRGRINCKQNHVSPQANDVGKSLIYLKNTLPIGNDALAHAWFKRHGAGTFAETCDRGIAGPWNEKAVDKLSFEDRERWVDLHEKEILADAENPWRDDALWLKADKALTYLAWTFEYADWLKSGKSPDFQCRIPCAQDGSCSGLQHISGMLRDEVCAFEVNLMPNNLPNDIYGKVAEVITPLVHKEAQTGNAMAKLWDGVITRACTKAAVMTFVYGAKDRTYVTQLLELLQKYEDKGKKLIEVSDDEKFNACAYLKEMISRGMRQVIVKGTQFMDWLQEIAQICAKVDLPIVWTMPDGVKVAMSYRQMKDTRVCTYWGSTMVRSRVNEPKGSGMASNKMKNGMAANFIHSYDACHLRTTINEFDHDIVVIHDSFAALPSVSANLHRTLQRTFMELYSDDRVESFIEDIQPLVDEPLPTSPRPGTWDPALMLQADFSFA